MYNYQQESMPITPTTIAQEEHEKNKETTKN